MRVFIIYGNMNMQKLNITLCQLVKVSFCTFGLFNVFTDKSGKSSIAGNRNSLT